MKLVKGLSLGLAGMLASLVAGVAATPADATQITYTSYSVIDDVNVHITCGAIPDCTSGYYGSGEIQFKNANTVVAQTWCIDVTHDLWSSGIFNVTLAQNTGGGMSNIRDDGGSGSGNFLSWNIVGEIGALMRYGAQNIDGVNDPNHWLSSAIQLAIWNLEYGANITTNSDSSDVNALAALLLSNAQSGAYGYDWGVAWLTYCNDAGNCNQGQLELVPEPPGLAVFGMALLTFGGLWSVRRRTGPQAGLTA